VRAWRWSDKIDKAVSDTSDLSGGIWEPPLTYLEVEASVRFIRAELRAETEESLSIPSFVA
jgi:hypothetical protein